MLFLWAFAIGFVLALPIELESELEADLYGTAGVLSVGLPGLRREVEWQAPWLCLPPGKKRKKHGPSAQTVWRSVQYLINKTTFWDLKIRPYIGLGDPAQTALVCGAVNGVARAAMAGLLQKARPKLFANAFECRPCFEEERLCVRISCIASVPMVHIIGAGLLLPINHWREKRNASH